MLKHLLFVLSSFLVLLLVGLFAYREVTAEWKGYQAGYYAKLAQKVQDEALAKTPLAISQVWSEGLRRADRCMTCHMGIGNPLFAKEPQPYTTHPFLTGYMAKHPFETFGCTLCHEGDGQAVTVAKTHGVVPHLDRQLRTGPYVEASCTKCHYELYAEELYWPETPMLMKGVRLARELGCGACHTIAQLGVKATLAPELSGLGSKTELAFYLVHDFSRIESSEHTLRAWEWEHFKDPQKIVPGTLDAPDPKDRVPPTIMPNWGLSEEEATALTVFVMSLRQATVEAIPRSYLPPVAGHEPFLQYRKE